MPLDVLECTRVTIEKEKSIKRNVVWASSGVQCAFRNLSLTCIIEPRSNSNLFMGNLFKSFYQLGLLIAIFRHERGISSKRGSLNHVDYVTGLCTHRPSLLPIVSSGELLGRDKSGP